MNTEKHCLKKEIWHLTLDYARLHGYWWTYLPYVIVFLPCRWIMGCMHRDRNDLLREGLALRAAGINLVEGMHDNFAQLCKLQDVVPAPKPELLPEAAPVKVANESVSVKAIASGSSFAEEALFQDGLAGTAHNRLDNSFTLVTEKSMPQPQPLPPLHTLKSIPPTPFSSFLMNTKLVSFLIAVGMTAELTLYGKIMKDVYHLGDVLFSITIPYLPLIKVSKASLMAFFITLFVAAIGGVIQYQALDWLRKQPKKYFQNFFYGILASASLVVLLNCTLFYYEQKRHRKIENLMTLSNSEDIGVRGIAVTDSSASQGRAREIHELQQQIAHEPIVIEVIRYVAISLVGLVVAFLSGALSVIVAFVAYRDRLIRRHENFSERIHDNHAAQWALYEKFKISEGLLSEILLRLNKVASLENITSRDKKMKVYWFRKGGTAACLLFALGLGLSSCSKIPEQDHAGSPLTKTLLLTRDISLSLNDSNTLVHQKEVLSNYLNKKVYADAQTRTEVLVSSIQAHSDIQQNQQEFTFAPACLHNKSPEKNSENEELLADMQRQQQYRKEKQAFISRLTENVFAPSARQPHSAILEILPHLVAGSAGKQHVEAIILSDMLQDSELRSLEKHPPRSREEAEKWALADWQHIRKRYGIEQKALQNVEEILIVLPRAIQSNGLSPFVAAYWKTLFMEAGVKELRFYKGSL